jgi:PhnB protein
MAIDVYINFNGNCREAVAFYAQVFGLEEPQIMTFGDVPPNPDFPITEATKNLVLHTNLKIHGSTIMFSDVPPGMPFVVGNNVTLVISSQSLEDIQSIFHKLEEGGSVEMELQETFWSKCYGFVIDKFGIGWQLSYSKD